MQRFSRALLACTVLAFANASIAQADVKLGDGTMLPEAPYFVVSYIEVSPDAAGTVASLIKKQVADSQSEKGSLRIEGLQRTGRPNHFMILETWADKAARQAHAKAGHTVNFRKAL